MEHQLSERGPRSLLVGSRRDEEGVLVLQAVLCWQPGKQQRPGSGHQRPQAPPQRTRPATGLSCGPRPSHACSCKPTGLFLQRLLCGFWGQVVCGPWLFQAPKRPPPPACARPSALVPVFILCHKRMSPQQPALSPSASTPLGQPPQDPPRTRRPSLPVVCRPGPAALWLL